MKNKRCIIIVLGVLHLTGCATSSRERILQGMFVAGTVGALYGLSKDSDRTANAALYGSAAAATAGVVGLMMDNPDTETKRLREEVEYLKRQQEVFDAGKVVSSSPATFGGQIPDKYKQMIRPGEWRVYDVDQWQEDGENRLIHQDKIMEMIPPSLIPRSGR